MRRKIGPVDGSRGWIPLPVDPVASLVTSPTSCIYAVAGSCSCLEKTKNSRAVTAVVRKKLNVQVTLVFLYSLRRHI